MSDFNDIIKEMQDEAGLSGDDSAMDAAQLLEGKPWGTMMERILGMVADALSKQTSQTYSRLPAKAWKQIQDDRRVISAAKKANSAIYDLHEAMQKVAAEMARAHGHKSIFDK